MMYRYTRPLFNNYGEVIGYQIIETNHPDYEEVEEEVEEKPEVQEKVTTDDVLDMAKFLKTFDGQFIKLFN